MGGATWRRAVTGVGQRTRRAHKLGAQFRFESFNAFNRVQFGSPGTQNGTTAFGVITFQQNQPRKLQVALKLIF